MFQISKLDIVEIYRPRQEILEIHCGKTLFKENLWKLSFQSMRYDIQNKFPQTNTYRSTQLQKISRNNRLQARKRELGP